MRMPLSTQSNCTILAQSSPLSTVWPYMTIQLGHPSLSRDASAWFAAMSDPRQHELARPARMPAPELPVVIEAASAHGVLPIVARNLRRLTAGDHRAIMIEGATAKRFQQ